VKPHRQHDDQHKRNRKGHGHLPPRVILNMLQTG